jgi:hypothetical protein
LRRQWILAGVALILGASLLVELYLDRIYPETLIEVTLPDIQLGEEQVYSFYREGQRIGTHSYAVTGREGTGASANYTMISTTDITYEGENILLRGEYIFNHLYGPLSYELNATGEDKHTRLQATFRQGEVELTVHSGSEVANVTEQVPDGVVLIENQMPGYWEILLQSTTLTPGKRYVVHAFIPQRGSAARLTLTVDRETSKVKQGDADIECNVIREADMGLVFYLYGGDLIQYRDEANGVTMTKDS